MVPYCAKHYILYWRTISRYLVDWKNWKHEDMVISLWFITKALLQRKEKKQGMNSGQFFPSEISATFANLEMVVASN